MGPVATCETLGSEWEQSVADGMNRSQDKHSFARMAHPPFLMPERFRRRSSVGRAAPL